MPLGSIMMLRILMLLGVMYGSQLLQVLLLPSNRLFFHMVAFHI